MYFFKPQTDRLLLLAMIFVAGLISVYDSVLSHLTRETLREGEWNPMAVWIIDNYGVNGLIYTKALGIVCCVVLLSSLLYSRYRAAIIGVFLFQCALFCFLSFYVAIGGFWRRDMLVPIKMVVKFYCEAF
jgi:hypothetical protein